MRRDEMRRRESVGRGHRRGSAAVEGWLWERWELRGSDGEGWITEHDGHQHDQQDDGGLDGVDDSLNCKRGGGGASVICAQVLRSHPSFPE